MQDKHQRKCIGCGALLQSENEALSGYTPILNKETKYCKRCFRLMHYNDLPKVLATNADYIKVIDHVIKQNGLMILVVDIFSFGISFNKEMIDRLRNKDVIIVLNKIDLLPKSMDISRIVEFVSKACEKVFFKVIAIHVVSSKKGYFIDDLVYNVDQFRRGRDVYILGCANVGKSSFINAILKRTTSRTDDLIATSFIPGTTLKEIIIPYFEDNKAYIDTPGLINSFDILNHIKEKDYKLVIPQKEIKPLTYQVFGSYTYFLGSLGYIKFTEAKDLSLVVYANDNLQVTRVKNDKLADTIEKRIGITIPPLLDNKEYQEETFELSKNNPKTIFFSGFGFIHIIGNVNVTIGYLKGTKVFMYDSITRGKNK